MRPSWTTTWSRRSRAFAPRTILPSVTKQPAICPTPDTMNVWRTSARPSTFSWKVGLEQALERVAHVVQGLVDDGVEPDVDALALGQRGGLRLGAHVEADDDGVRRRGEQHVGLGDAADRAVQHVQAHVVRREPRAARRRWPRPSPGRRP